MSTVQDLSVAVVGHRVRVTDTDLMLEGVLFSLEASVAEIPSGRFSDVTMDYVPGYKTVTLKIGRTTASVRLYAQIEVLS